MNLCIKRSNDVPKSISHTTLSQYILVFIIHVHSSKNNGKDLNRQIV
jgi:hypothetical protein